MNGAQSLVQTLLNGGVDVCFTNPGTSEMHFVAALDQHPEMKCVLCLFEGVATGAADGYARMTGTPAATLLHTGPGLANGLANLHNAKRAFTPMVNIVGDHATYHLKHDSPLTSDVPAVAAPFSHWVKSADTAEEVAGCGAEAIAVAQTAPGQIASLILPADTAWNEASGPAEVPAIPEPARVPADKIAELAEVLKRGEPTVFIMSSHALMEDGLEAAGRIKAVTPGLRLITQTSNRRIERGEGRVTVERLAYPVDQVIEQLSGIKHLVLVGAKAPVAFFAYPNKPGDLVPEGCELHELASREEDMLTALQELADALGAAPDAAVLQELALPDLPKGPLTIEAIGDAVTHLMPEDTIVVDEAVTSGRALAPVTAGARRHTWLQLTGGAIGDGLPMSVGAAVACPDRKVLTLQADGSAMYTVQALWTQARENLDITTIIFNNRAYKILQGEMKGVGAAEPGRNARDMLELDRPALDWLSIAKGMGVTAKRAEDAESFAAALKEGLAHKGPFLIDAVI
ncbi:acetolactate synthase large subunit [Rhodovibrionaceae bacterium A322]